MAELVKVTIDGQEALVPKGTLIVEAAKQVGIEIPIFCYHEKMHPVGACRQCLVEIEKVPKLQTACTTPVADGMVVKTDTPAVLKARKGILEFLLVNHPLDCPVCDKGGECPLQNTTFEHASDRSRYGEEKRHFLKPIRLSPNVVLDRERCIMCTRCVRFQREIAGDESLTLINRGSRSEVGVMPGRTFDSPFSGNTVELCPVGALTSAKFRFRARSWELKKTASLCGLCSVGCNVSIQHRDGEVKRVLSRENGAVDDGWLCDRGRFTYQPADHPERLTSPMVRKDGSLVPATWDEALAAAAEGLKRAGDAVGGLASAWSTNEELYLFQKLFRAALKSNSVDHGPNGRYSRPEIGPDGCSGSIAALERARLILHVGVDPIANQPVLDLRLKKARNKRGARLIGISSGETDLTSISFRWLRTNKGAEAAVVNGLARLLLSDGYLGDAARERLGDRYDRITGAVADYSPETVQEVAGVPAASLKEVAALLATTSKVAVLFPRPMPGDPEGLREACGWLSLATGGFSDGDGGLFPLSAEANAQGAIDMGVLPNLLPGQRELSAGNLGELSSLWGSEAPAPQGLTGLQMMEAALVGRLKVLYLLGLDPLGQAGGQAVVDAISGADFVVVQDVFLTATAQRAQVVLPGLALAEKEGTLTNLERRVQRLRVAVPAPGAALADWRIIAELANRLGADWGYADAEAVFAEMVKAVPIYQGVEFGRLGLAGQQWRYPGVPEESAGGNGRVRKMWYLPRQAVDQVQETGV